MMFNINVYNENYLINDKNKSLLEIYDDILYRGLENIYNFVDTMKNVYIYPELIILAMKHILIVSNDLKIKLLLDIQNINNLAKSSKVMTDFKKVLADALFMLCNKDLFIMMIGYERIDKINKEIDNCLDDEKDQYDDIECDEYDEWDDIKEDFRNGVLKIQEDEKYHKFIKDKNDGIFKNDSCPITQDIFINPVMIKCGHIFEFFELMKYMSISQTIQKSCPLCRKEIEFFT